MSVTSKVLYDMPSKALPSKRSRHCLQPTSGNANFTESQQMEFLIPASHVGQYLNCENTCLRFKCEVTQPCRFDHNATSVIDRMEVYVGSQMIENTLHYSTLYSNLLNIQLDKLAQSGGVAITQGTAEETDDAHLTGIGHTFTAAGESIYISLPLMSSVVGLLADEKNFPIGKLSSSIRIVLYLDSARNALVKTTVDVPTFTLSKVFLDTDILELSGQAQMVADAANSGFGDTIQIATKQWSHYLYTLPTTLGPNAEVSKLVDARFSSINQILFCFRNMTGDTEGYCKTSSVNPYSNFQVRVAGEYYPKKRLEFPQGAAAVAFNHEGYIETQKCWHALSSLVHWGSVTKTTYNKRDVAFANLTAKNLSYTNKYFLSLDFEAYTNKSGLIFDGLSTINDTIMVTGALQSANLENTINVDCFIQHDSVISIDPSGVVTRSM